VVEVAADLVPLPARPIARRHIEAGDLRKERRQEALLEGARCSPTAREGATAASRKAVGEHRRHELPRELIVAPGRAIVIADASDNDNSLEAQRIITLRKSRSSAPRAAVVFAASGRSAPDPA